MDQKRQKVTGTSEIEIKFKLSKVAFSLFIEEEDTTEGREAEILSYDRLLAQATKALPGHACDLLLRDCYREMWEHALSSTRFLLQHKLTLLGNSGIGKSGMLVYLAYRLLMEGKRVFFLFRQMRLGERRMLRIDPCSKRDIGSGEVVFAATFGVLSDFPEVENSTDVYVLVDGFATTDDLIVGKQILACSPDDKKNKYVEWSKNGTTLYMPPWSEQEMLTANKLIYKVDEGEFWKLYTMVGGFPLRVFNNPIVDEEELHEPIQRYLASPFMNHNACHRVCSLQPLPGYRTFRYDFNSAHIRLQVAKFRQSEDRKQLRERVMASTLPLLQTIRRKEAEWEVHEVLFKGGSFKCKKFSSGNRQPEALMELKLSEQLPALYNPQGGIREGEYYLGKTCNQGAWDAFFLLDGKLFFVQVTVSSKHSKKIVYLQTIMKKAGVSTATLLFVGPPDTFQQFRFTDNPDRSPHDEIEQWAVEVDLLA